MLKATVSGDDVRRAIADLKEIDPKLVTALRRDLRTKLSGPAAAVESGWPARGALPSGMANSMTRMSYEKPSVKVSFTPGVARRGRVSSLLSLTAKLPKNSAGAWIGEMAGMRGNYGIGRSREYMKNGEAHWHMLNGQGQALVKALNAKYPVSGRGGRWGWRKFVNMKDNIRTLGEGVLNDAVSVLNRES